MLDNSDDLPTFFRLPMVKNNHYRLLSRSLAKKVDRNAQRVSNIDNSEDPNDNNFKGSYDSIIEIDTNENYINDIEEEKNSIEPGIIKRQKKLIKHLENNSNEIKDELMKKITMKIPKLSYKMNNLAIHPDDLKGKQFFFNKVKENNDITNNSADNDNKDYLLNSNMKMKQSLNDFNNNSLGLSNNKKNENENIYFESSNKFVNDKNNILESSPEKPKKGHFRNLSNAEFTQPKKFDSFIGGNYLRNLNDFHIAECGTPEKNRFLNVSFLPNKSNKSSMDDLSKNLEEIYSNKVSMATPIWPLFHEKFYTLHKLNDFGIKKTDFKNTLYKSEIHIDKPYVPQNANKSYNNKAKIILKKDSLNEKTNFYIRKINTLKKLDNNQDRLKSIERNLENINIQETTKRNFSTNRITLGDKTLSNNNTERSSLYSLRNKQRNELRLTNLNSVQLKNINMSNTFSNNPILRISENTMMKVDNKSDTDINHIIKEMQIKKRKFHLDKTNQTENEKNISFQTFNPVNIKEKISNIEKARKIMYDNKMSKLIDYFKQGGI